MSDEATASPPQAINRWVGAVGLFIAPTVFDGVTPAMRIGHEEIFGPVMSVLRFASEEEAYRIANDVEFGLRLGHWRRWGWRQFVPRVGSADHHRR